MTKLKIKFKRVNNCNILLFVAIFILFNTILVSLALGQPNPKQGERVTDETTIANELQVLADTNGVNLNEPLNRGKAVFFMTDPLNDDKGTGKYYYPIDHAFDPGNKIFDLTKFELDNINNNYIFNLTFQVINNVWGAPEGFSHQLVQIYIVNPLEKEKGRIDTLKEGAYVSFNPQYPWNYMIKVMSWRNTAVYNSQDDIDSYGRKEGITSKLLPDNHTIQVSIPKKYLPSNPGDWYYYVLIGGQDGFGPDNFRPVTAKHDEWKFGGGSTMDFDPNVIDMLDTGKGARAQYKMLSNYSITDGKYAVLHPVGPQDNQKPSLTKIEKQQNLYLNILRGIGIIIILLFITVIILRRLGR